LRAIRRWQRDNVEHLEVYTKDEVIKYEKGKEIERYFHYIGDVPVIEFPNNDDRIGDFERVMTLIDAYDKAQSNIANDFEYFSDAYLVLKNLSSTQPEDIENMKLSRTMLIDDAGDAKWLLKDVQDSAHENFKRRLAEDIHRFSQTPNLTDESFAGNASGVALRYKLLGLEWNASVKERKFKRALQRRIELICNVLNLKGANYDWREIDIQFHRNLPQNELEQVQIASMLKGIISDDTLLSIIPYIDDPSNEMEKIGAQGTFRLSDFEEPDEL
jgi:SPP1 family phage portal protein